MDKLEFETRAMTNPESSDPDFLSALNEETARQQFVDEARDFGRRLNKTINSVLPPEKLAIGLKRLALTETESNVYTFNLRKYPYRSLALAASLVLALAVTLSVGLNSKGPTESELAFGQHVIDHVYKELDQYNSPVRPDYQSVDQLVGSVGGNLRNDSSVTNLQVSFAKPCIILPTDNPGAHLALKGSQGVVNVIVINNSPVATEFSINDERFNGVVIPFAGGNMIIIGEKTERLGNYRELLDDNVEWVI